MLPNNTVISSNPNPEDQIKIVKTWLESLKTESEQKAARLEAEVQRAVTMHLSPQAQAQRRQEVENHEALTKQAVKDYEGQIASLQAKIDERKAEVQKRNQSAMEARKAHALDAWHSGGGSKSDFEIAWPKIREHILTEAILDTSNPVLDAKRREYAAFI